MHRPVPKWRNRQTRRSQTPLRATSCGFESHLRHHNWQSIGSLTDPDGPTRRETGGSAARSSSPIPTATGAFGAMCRAAAGPRLSGASGASARGRGRLPDRADDRRLPGPLGRRRSCSAPRIDASRIRPPCGGLLAAAGIRPAHAPDTAHNERGTGWSTGTWPPSPDATGRTARDAGAQRGRGRPTAHRQCG
jgi:hypothetical protein